MFNRAGRRFSLSNSQGLYLALALGAFSLVLIASQWSRLTEGLDHSIALVENYYQQWFDQQNTENPLILLPLAFFGGLLASFSPCILALLPVNLSYIGTLKVTSRRQALVKASLFVLGTVIVLSLFGLASGFATAIIVDFKGYVHLAIGVIILLMGLSFAGLIHLPLPQTQINLPVAGPLGVGMTFALVSSPCASPVLFAVLAAAATTGSQSLSVLTMVFYALGYTAVIFLASLFTGIVKQSRVLLEHSDWVMRIGSVLLILAGGYYVLTGLGWFF
ncbi:MULTISPECIES: cytochrome c biogenesis protein CcdA [unclassified Synechocystis]|uniref:cytochrome c biogenesis protein CcdA n=1 Tax=unclassified Synechocystis TaxID=2640012 RepID=UPI0004123EBB|nr:MULTISPECIES: cytochrome c biogenesis protein CcdA [unclassified Synechocystis]AIE75205.1 Cytochrome c biogenesis protein [Synechocystis sp. PCC 6714]MCT0252958.1 cytochrome C biogenesis protein CcdA [Synechocystis sp. CS-94]